MYYCAWVVALMALMSSYRLLVATITYQGRTTPWIVKRQPGVFYDVLYSNQITPTDISPNVENVMFGRHIASECGRHWLSASSELIVFPSSCASTCSSSLTSLASTLSYPECRHSSSTFSCLLYCCTCTWAGLALTSTLAPGLIHSPDQTRL
jgi:hypothetical protein